MYKITFLVNTKSEFAVINICTLLKTWLGEIGTAMKVNVSEPLYEKGTIFKDQIPFNHSNVVIKDKPE